MLGGPVRDRLQLYWSHCGTWRVSYADRIKEWTGFDPIRSLDDVGGPARRWRAAASRALKTNIMRFDGTSPYIAHAGLQRRRLAGAEHRAALVDATGGARWRRSATAPGPVSGCIST